MNREMVYYIPQSDSIGWSDGGSITVHIPMSSVRSLYSRLRAAIGDDGPDSVEGFFDFVKKAVSTVGKVVSSLAKNNIVKAVAGVIPYGATALTVIEMADSALGSAKKAVARKPAAHKLVRQAAAGLPAAKKVLHALPPAARAKLKRVAVLQREAFALKADLDAARKALAASGYTPGLQKALKIARAPWT